MPLFGEPFENGLELTQNSGESVEDVMEWWAEFVKKAAGELENDTHLSPSWPMPGLSVICVDPSTGFMSLTGAYVVPTDRRQAYRLRWDMSVFY